MGTAPYVRFFEDFSIDDVPLVGGKNASLGEMFQKLSGQGVRVPHGFAITAAAYRHMLDEAGAGPTSRRTRRHRPRRRRRAGAKGQARQRDRRLRWTTRRPGGRDLEGYRAFSEEYGEEVSLAVRSSATAEACHGQLRRTAGFVSEHQWRRESARHVSPVLREPLHRPRDPLPNRSGLRPLQVSLSIGVMKMVRSDIASSGVMFSLDTESGFHDAVFVTGAYGLGETSYRAPSTQTSSTSTSRRIAQATAPYCVACSATRP